MTKKSTEQLIKEANSGGTFEEWTQRRQFIAGAIHKPGSILDLGCANAFFLKCLQDWCPHELIPYGVDIREEAITYSHELYPDQIDHFVCMSGDDLGTEQPPGFPDTFDFVYRNYWGSHVDSPEKVTQVIEQSAALVSPKGRLILGAYFGNQHPFDSEGYLKERETLLKFADFIKSGSPQIDGEILAHKANNWIMWIDKDL